MTVDKDKKIKRIPVKERKVLKTRFLLEDAEDLENEDSPEVEVDENIPLQDMQ